jgi:hypothetical protein
MKPQPFTITKAQADLLARQVSLGAKLTFENQANRNWVAKLARTNYRCATIKSSIKGQSLDPRYVVETSDLPDKGLGNDRSWYSTLYKLEKDPYPMRVR